MKATTTKRAAKETRWAKTPTMIEIETMKLWESQGTIWETQRGEENRYFTDEFGKEFYCKCYPREDTTAKSRGHVAFWQQPGFPKFELYKDAEGGLWITDTSSSMNNGYRFGRWESPAHLAQYRIDAILEFEKLSGSIIS